MMNNNKCIHILIMMIIDDNNLQLKSIILIAVIALLPHTTSQTPCLSAPICPVKAPSKYYDETKLLCCNLSCNLKCHHVQVYQKLMAVSCDFLYASPHCSSYSRLISSLKG